MTKKHYAFFTVVIGLAIFAQYDIGKRAEQVRVAKEARNIAKAQAAADTESKKKVEVDAGPTTAEFVKLFKAEVGEIGKIQNNPDAVQARMKKLADVMTAKHVDGLYDIISDDQSNPDERALAVELLALKNDTMSLMALQNFVANTKNINGTKWDQKKELETVLRAQAVEGIAGYPEKEIAISTLNYLQQKVDQKFLSERISRASMSLMYDNKPVTQQDEEALKKLVE